MFYLAIQQLLLLSHLPFKLPSKINLSVFDFKFSVHATSLFDTILLTFLVPSPFENLGLLEISSMGKCK